MHLPALLAYFFIPPGILMILFIFVFGFAIYAQIRVSSAYSKNLQVLSRGGITGREAAQAVMARAGIADVTIEETDGHLTDHYDPANRKLVLSAENYQGTSLAAVGVAAHEAGHALQHQESFQMLEFRMALIPATQIASGAREANAGTKDSGAKTVTRPAPLRRAACAAISTAPGYERDPPTMNK